MYSTRSLLVVSQFWISVIRAIFGLCFIGLCALEINWWQKYEYAKNDVKGSSILLAFWIVFVLNDLFMATVDWKRSNTYLGCVAAQIIANSCFIVLVAISDCATAAGRFRVTALTSASIYIAGSCSVYLLFLHIGPIPRPSSHATMRQIMAANTKDVLMGVFPPSTGFKAPNVLGHPRKVALPDPSNFFRPPRYLLPITRTLGRLFFRRVKPVETRLYAFIRNSFAVIAVGVLIFRTVTATRQAQNEISTRVISENCSHGFPGHELYVLSDHMVGIVSNDSYVSLPEAVNITVSVEPYGQPNGGSGRDPFHCAAVWAHNFSVNIPKTPSDSNHFQNRILQLFKCGTLVAPTSNFWRFRTAQARDSYSSVYHIRAQPASGLPGGELYDAQMPDIWLVNLQNSNFDTSSFNPSSFDPSDVNEVRRYLPPFKLRYGSQIEAEANLITRRFIESSIVRDVVFNSKPNYRSLPLYPIVKTSVAPLNASDSSVAVANVRPVLAPGLMYYRSQPEVQNPTTSLENVCDFIEEYRSGTILDIVGSVGGLFALLQAAHLLLFGRPLFWGLTGAKSITPFGLLGSCSSRSFKERLKNEYHSKSCEDGADTIRIVQFLRDFVVDFGPADLDLGKRTERESVASPPNLVGKTEDSVNTQIPLMQMGSNTTISPDHDDTGKGVDRSNPDHNHSMV